MPVLVLDDGTQINDSSAICSRLAAEAEAARRGGALPGAGALSWLRSLASAGGARPGVAKGDQAGDDGDEETKWRRWVDQKYVRLVTVNIYRTVGEAWQTFNYITTRGNFGWAERQASRVAGTGMMWAIGGNMKKKYGIEGDARAALYASADEWVAALGGRQFMGGSAPNLADLSVFGVTRAVVGTDTFRDLMLHSEGLAPWYQRVAAAVGDGARLPDNDDEP